jgi:hypothetical protein
MCSKDWVVVQAISAVQLEGDNRYLILVTYRLLSKSVPPCEGLIGLPRASSCRARSNGT